MVREGAGAFTKGLHTWCGKRNELCRKIVDIFAENLGIFINCINVLTMWRNYCKIINVK